MTTSPNTTPASRWEDLLFRIWLIRQRPLTPEEVLRLDRHEATVRHYLNHYRKDGE